MPKKKKGKGNKLARMSDEERARYLQHRAELELEAKRRKQQLIAIFTKVCQIILSLLDYKLEFSFKKFVLTVILKFILLGWVFPNFHPHIFKDKN